MIPGPPTIVRRTDELPGILERLAPPPELISFDVFDTLLLRRCHPILVRQASTRYVAARSGVPVEVAETAREAAFSYCCTRNRRSGADPECGIAEWFDRWITLLAEVGGTPPMDMAAKATAHELELETLACIPDERAVTALRTARSMGARVVAITDMYLSGSHVRSLLGPLGEHIDAVYTSGDTRLLKRSGRLFDHVASCEGVRGGRHVHVGDDLVADGLRPVSRGLRAILLRDRDQIQRRLDQHAAGPRHGRAARLGPASVAYCTSGREALDPAERVGLTTFGPILVPFIHAVAESARADGVDRLFFLAREGLVLKRIYDLLAPPNAPPSVYLCVSRFTTLVAQMRHVGKHERAALSANDGSPTPRRALSSLGLGSDLDAACEATGILPDARLPLDDPRFASLCDHPLVVVAATRAGASMRAGLLAHLRSTGFLDGGFAGIVDVGWGGQIQSSLAAMGRDEPAIPRMRGYYFGLDQRARGRILDGDDMVALASRAWAGDWASRGIFEFVMALEAATRAPHGTTIGYGMDGSPRFAGSESPSRKAELAADPVLAGIQRGIIAYAKNYAAFCMAFSVRSEHTLPLARVMAGRLARFPGHEVRLLFEGVVNAANLGSEETIPYLPDHLSWHTPLSSIRRARWCLWQEAALGVLGGRPAQVLLVAAKALSRPVIGRSTDVVGLPSIGHGMGQKHDNCRHDFLYERLLSELMSMPLSGLRERTYAKTEGATFPQIWGWAAYALATLARGGIPSRPGIQPAAVRIAILDWINARIHILLLGQFVLIKLKLVGMLLPKRSSSAKLKDQAFGR